MEEVLNFLKTNDNLYLIPSYIENPQKIKSAWKELGLKEHVFICSSGTTGGDNIKTYALSKASLLANAKSVNSFLKAADSDRWLASLPIFHIGGLSIYIRALQSKSDVITYNEKWNASSFQKTLVKENIQYTSLVPTQLFDLVQGDHEAPNYLKGIFIGGDFLDSCLEKKALKLGWPIISTYGMTESCSQVASSYAKDKQGGYLQVLPHNKILKTEKRAIFELQSKSLATLKCEFSSSGHKVTKIGIKNFLIPDLLSCQEVGGVQFIRPLGRLGDEFKLKGRLVSLLELKNLVAPVIHDFGLFGQVDLIVRNSPRDGGEIIVIAQKTCADFLPEFLRNCNELLPSFCQITDFEIRNKFSRTELGKIKGV